jgi:hypothetical protein
MTKEYPMCDTCSLETNRAQWANYPAMLEVCKMCKSFQQAIYNTIDEQQKILDQTKKDLNSLEEAGN